MSQTPSEARIEDRESEATNKESPDSHISPLFSIVWSLFGINSCSKVYFMTVHPYPKDIKACSTIGKVYDKYKKFFPHLFIVKEKTQKGNPHFHILGIGGDPPKVLKHNKIWSVKIVTGTGEKLPDYGDYIADALNFMDNPDPILLRAMHIDDVKAYYVSKYYSISDQCKFILSYMLKENPSHVYDDYLIK